MKPNFGVELQKYALADPPRAHVIVQAVKETASDIKDTKTDYAGADTTVGWAILADGGARPTGTTASAVAASTADTADAITSLGGMTAATLPVPVVEWFGPSVEAEELRQLVARLDPVAGTTTKVVQYWRAQLWRVASVRPFRQDYANGEYWDFEPLTFPVTVTAGSVVSDVTFEFGNVRSDVGDPPEYPEGSDGSGLSRGRPATAVVIEALDANNQIASNVAWIGDTADDSETNNSHIVSRFDLSNLGTPAEDPTYTRKQTTGQSVNGLPRFRLRSRAYTEQTLTWSGAGNRLDLGAAPTNPVEFVVESEQPGGSSLTAQARVVNGSTTWTTVQDGQLDSDVGLTGSTGGEYEVRVISTPSTAGNAIATVRRVGVREVTITTLASEMVSVSNPTYSLDPDTFKASIPTLDLALQRDLRDYRDYATELFSDNHPGEIDFRVMYGSTSLARQHWMHLDTFRLYNYETAGDPVVIQAVHPLALAKQTVPVGTTSGQSALVFSGSTDTTESAYSVLLDTPNVPGRYKGVRLTTSTSGATKIGHTLVEPRPLKDELDRLAFIEGGAVIPSGGRYKWRRMFTTTGGFEPLASELTRLADVEAVGVSPNLDRRVVSYRAPYNWNEALDNGRGGYANQVFTVSTAAQSKLGHGLLGSHQDLPDDTAKWLRGSTYASAITARTLRSRKQGMVVLRVRPDLPQPQLELGDPVVVPTDRFVGRSLETDRAIRGRSAFYGVVVEHDMLGSELAVWVPEIDPFERTPTATAITQPFRPTVDPPDFDVSIVRVKGSTSATAILTTNDPGKRIVIGSTAIQYRVRTPGSTLGAWTNWSSTFGGSTGTPGTDTTLTRQVTVGTPPGLEGEFRWRVHYTDPDNTARKYGTTERLANFDSVTKTVTLDHLRIQAVQPDAHSKFYAAQYLYGAADGNTRFYRQSITVPIGATIESFQARAFAGTTDEYVTAKLRRVTTADVAVDISTQSVWRGEGPTWKGSTGLSYLTKTREAYQVEISLFNNSTIGGTSGAAQARFYRAEIQYNAPDYTVGL